MAAIDINGQSESRILWSVYEAARFFRPATLSSLANFAYKYLAKSSILAILAILAILLLLGFLPVLFQHRIHRVRREVFVKVIVDLHGGRPAACANAFHFFQ